jgi:predicted double-glycine peptidase
MTDVYLAMAGMILLCVPVFFFAARWARSRSKRATVVAVLCVLGGFGVWALVIRNQLWLTRVVPHPALVVTSNWIPLFSAALAGLAWARGSGTRLRRALPVFALAGTALFSLLEPVVLRAESNGDFWVYGVCMQSSQSTCSAACAATLLAWHGLPATEREMVRLCLTTRRGTSILGMYHGLGAATVGTDWRVVSVEPTLDALKEAVADGPVAITVGLPRFGDVDPRYENHWGWQRGKTHTVVLFQFLENGLIDVGDPSIGRELWSVKALKTLWRDDALQLVRARHAD